MAEHRGGSGNFAEGREKASEADRKDGQHSNGSFKNDSQRTSKAGKKGGQNSHGGDRESDDSRLFFFLYPEMKVSPASLYGLAVIFWFRKVFP